MAAAKGNKNAVGNSGGKSLNDRQLAASVRSLALKEIKTVLEGKDAEYKKAVILKLAPTLLPRLNEHTGEDGRDLFPVPILANMNVQPRDSDNQDSEATKTD